MYPLLNPRLWNSVIWASRNRSRMAKYISIHTESFRRGSLTSIPGFSWSEFNLVVFEDMDEIEVRGLSCWQKRADHPKTPWLSHQPRLKIISLPIFSTLCASRGVKVSADWPQVRSQGRNNLMEEDRPRRSGTSQPHGVKCF